MADRIGAQFGNYTLIRQLGEGGFAEVYLGEHIHLGTQAASAPIPSLYRGQRPRFSRYSTPMPTSLTSNLRSAQLTSDNDSGNDVDDKGNEETINFEADFDYEDDPLNDINIYRKQK